MRHLKSLSLLFLIIFGTTAQSAIIEQIVIDKKAVAIEKKMTQDCYIFYGLTGLSIVYHLSLLSEWGKGSNQSSGEQTIPSDESVSMIERLKSGFRQMAGTFKSGFNYMFYTQEGWVATMQMCVAIGSSVFLSNICEKFAHPDTLRWYINAHACHHLTLKMMKKQLLMVQDPSVDDYAARVERCNEYLPLLYARLVRQSVAICAYMAYKTKYLNDEEKMVAERSKVLMVNAHNNWLHRIAAQLASANRDYQALIKLIIAYEDDIAFQINHFALVEGETMQDRSVVKKANKEALADAKEAN